MDIMFWNILLTAGLGLIGWMGKTMWSEQNRLSILLNRTREEMAKDHPTRYDVHNDINRVVARLDAIDGKIDRLIERMQK